MWQPFNFRLIFAWDRREQFLAFQWAPITHLKLAGHNLTQE